MRFLMKELDKIKNMITQLCKDRYCHPGPFEEFTAHLSELGVVRQTYDVIKNELLFYSKNQLLLTLTVTDFDKSQEIYPFSIGEVFNVDALKKAIMDFDSGTISSSTEFHKQIALAGIIYVSVHLVPKKIYYLSQDAQFYLESY